MALQIPLRLSWFSRTAGSFLRNLQSENIGGLVSMLGSCLFLFGGDGAGVVVTLSFLAAEVILTRAGHLRVGYSLGCLLFALGDALAVTTMAAHGNRAFQTTLAVMAAAWLIGAARAPLAWYGRHVARPELVTAADALQPLAGIATLLLRIPGLLTALAGSSFLGAAAVACWAASDVLIGRLQDAVRLLVSAWKSRAHLKF
jgi:hypothetical protein